MNQRDGAEEDNVVFLGFNTLWGFSNGSSSTAIKNPLCLQIWVLLNEVFNVLSMGKVTETWKSIVRITKHIQELHIVLADGWQKAHNSGQNREIGVDGETSKMRKQHRQWAGCHPSWGCISNWATQTLPSLTPSRAKLNCPNACALQGVHREIYLPSALSGWNPSWPH